MFKHLRSILSIGAVMVGATCFAEATSLLSIDYTQKETFPYENYGESERITMSAEDGLVYTNSTDGWHQFCIGDGISLTNGQFFTVKAVAKATANIDIHAYVGNGDDCGGTMKITTEWSEVSFVSQALYTNGGYRIMFQPGGWNGTVCFKSVEVTSGDEGYDPALLCIKASNIEKKTNQWDNQLNYEFNPKEPHGKYSIAFDVYGDNDGKANINWGMGAKSVADDEWKELWGGTNPLEHREPEFDVVKDTWKHYEYTYTIEENDTYDGDPVTRWLGVIKFEFGNKYEGTLYFDNIVLRKAGSDVDLIPNGDFNYMNLGKWAKGWQHTYNLEIAHGPEHPEGEVFVDPNVIWNDPPLALDWGIGVSIDPKKFANLEVGDIMIIKYKNTGAGTALLFGSWQINYDINWYQQNDYPFYTDNGKDEAVIEFTEAMLDFDIVKTIDTDNDGTPDTEVHYNLFDIVKAHGMVIRGVAATLNEIIYIPVNKIAFVNATNNLSFNTNYAGKEDGNWVANSVKLTDARYVDIADDFTAKEFTYVRNFTSDNWQALYVPYDMEAGEWAELGTVAELKDATKVGDEVTLTWETVETGSLTPNTPYIFKPAAAGQVEFKGENKSVKAAVSSSVSAGCATLTGIYTEKKDMATDEAYALSGGTFYRTNDNAKTLKPFRIYLTVVGTAGAKVRNLVNGEVTGIEDIITELPADGTYYDLMGRKIESPATSGLYINGGQKVIIRK